MYTRRFHKPGTPPATLVAPPQAAKPRIRVMQYDAAGCEQTECPDAAALLASPVRRAVRWIDIEGLGDVELLRAVGQRFGLHPLALEDVLNTPQRPKVERYEKHLFIVFPLISATDECEIVFEQVSLFVGADFLITIQERADDDFAAVRDRLLAGRGFARSRGHDYLAYALLDVAVDQLFPVLESLGESLEDLQDRLVENPGREAVGEIHDAKRALLALRRAAWPMRELLSALERDDSGVVTAEARVFLRDCYDHAIQAIDIIESYREMAGGMMDLYLSSLGNRTNEVMRVLTVVSATFIPLTFLAGIYGMNFEVMPELRIPWAYPALLGTMALLAGTLIAFFRKKRWL